MCVYKNVDNSLSVDWVDIVSYIRNRVGKKRYEMPFYKKVALGECAGLVMDNIVGNISLENEHIHLWNSFDWAKTFLLLTGTKDAGAESHNSTKLALDRLMTILIERIMENTMKAGDVAIVKALKIGAKRLYKPEWLSLSKKIHYSLKKNNQIITDIYGKNYQMLTQLDQYNKTEWKEAWNLL